MPSIQIKWKNLEMVMNLSFKPCYNWNAFNTTAVGIAPVCFASVLNLIINGIPSILKEKQHLV